VGSIVSGFEYDVFISYRHNDNRSGWISEFVNALQHELATTVKEPLTIYFDKNPHDGLLETHSVDKSLAGKLKCLIFIPIISQTYRDPKSFAWQHEFCAFNEIAKHDQFGRDIKLASGNVASRILPVRIHDLDTEDKAAIENEIAGVLRAVDFIYKEPGVNRPLKATDSKTDNQNKTDYYNQVNKVANAVKEIIHAIGESKILPESPAQRTALTAPRSTRTSLMVGASLLVMIVVAFFLYRSPSFADAQPDKSVAVLAFVDMSPGKDQEWFSDGLSEEILNSLANLRELKVTARTSSFYYKDKDVSLQEIAEKLGVAHIVEGSVRRNGEQLRITAQLIRAQDGFHMWSDTYDRTADDVFRVQTEIAESIAKMLLSQLSPKAQQMLAASKSQNVEAYEYYLKGCRGHFQKYYVTMQEQDFSETEKYFLKSISLDPDYAETYGALADLYDSRSNIPQDRKTYRWKRDSLIHIGLKIDPNSAQTNCVNGWSFLKRESPNLDSAYYYFTKAHEISPNSDFAISGMSGFYGMIGVVDLEARYLDRALEVDPLHTTFLTQRGLLKMSIGLYDEAKQQFEKSLELDQANGYAQFYIGAMAATQGDMLEVKRRIDAMRGLSTTARWRSTTTLEALALAMEGKKAEALAIGRNDLRMLSILKMRDQFLLKLDSITSAPNRFSPAGLESDPQYDFVRDDQRFKKIFERVEKKYESMKEAYPTPD
jgi:TolB-like protein/Tfp pilus assembly protein PilF